MAQLEEDNRHLLAVAKAAAKIAPTLALELSARGMPRSAKDLYGLYSALEVLPEHLRKQIGL